MGSLLQMLNLPGFLGQLLIIMKFIGAICLSTGSWTQFRIFLVRCLFFEIILMVNLPYTIIE